jgi:hypothetical protein
MYSADVISTISGCAAEDMTGASDMKGRCSGHLCQKAAKMTCEVPRTTWLGAKKRGEGRGGLQNHLQTLVTKSHA